jgi:heme/copper-type cytochrome/quinol oxidase subunit 4
MPQNLERDFQKAAFKLKQKNRNILKQKIIVFILTLLLIAGLFSLNTKYHLHNISSVNIVIIVAIFIIASLIVYFINVKIGSNPKSRSRSSRSQPIFIHSKHFIFLKSIKPQHYLILLILLVSANTHSIKDFAVRVGYNPTPHLLASPWPWKNNETIHPIIASITPNIESSIKSVAEYIVMQESDPYLQIKALHDYVISRVSYDFHALEIGVQPPQDAQTVFSTRKAVCGGYANLFMALGKSIGIDVAVIQGNIRRDLASQNLTSLNIRRFDANNDLTLHAWNAVKIAGNWQLVDTTWDDSNLDQNLSLYNSHYLMPPPNVMIISHFPEQSDWQLLHHPMNRDNFERQLTAS